MGEKKINECQLLRGELRTCPGRENQGRKIKRGGVMETKRKEK